MSQKEFGVLVLDRGFPLAPITLEAAMKFLEIEVAIEPDCNSDGQLTHLQKMYPICCFQLEDVFGKRIDQDDSSKPG